MREGGVRHLGHWHALLFIWFRWFLRRPISRLDGRNTCPSASAHQWSGPLGKRARETRQLRSPSKQGHECPTEIYREIIVPTSCAARWRDGLPSTNEEFPRIIILQDGISIARSSPMANFYRKVNRLMCDADLFSSYRQLSQSDPHGCFEIADNGVLPIQNKFPTQGRILSRKPLKVKDEQ